MKITEITRRAIVDEMILGKVNWAGRLEEPDLVARVFDMENLPSHDPRFGSAYRDAWQHRVNNYDWEGDWVFYDDRFALMRGPDEVFLRFLAETVHPVVRPSVEEAKQLVALYNRHLRNDGFELAQVTQMSGYPVYGAREVLSIPRSLSRVAETSGSADADYLTRQITRMEAAIEEDPELAIGTAKELVETCCTTILNKSGAEISKTWDLPRLVKETAKKLQLSPDDVAATAASVETIRRTLGSLGGIVAGIAELRNAYGTGHGKPIGTSGLKARHARLAVGAASTLAVFLFETHEARLEHS